MLCHAHKPPNHTKFEGYTLMKNHLPCENGILPLYIGAKADYLKISHVHVLLIFILNVEN